MLNSSELGDELDVLKLDVSQLLNATRDECVDASKATTDTLADEIMAGLTELKDILDGEDSHIRQLISNRLITSLASAFALGVVVGLAMRRH